jgi:membrane-associated phospholipid phosphatase
MDLGLDIETYVLGGLYLLDNEPMDCGLLLVGVLFNSALNPILKTWFPQPRPNEDAAAFQHLLEEGKEPPLSDLGMPSFHAETLSFVIVFVAMTLRRQRYWIIFLVMIFICFFLLAKEYIIGEHSLSQLAVGSAIGSVLAFSFGSVANRFLRK